MLRELSLQTFDASHSRIGRIADAENDFVLGVILLTVTAEALIDLGIDSLQRLQDGNRGCVGGAGAGSRFAHEKEVGRAIQTNEVVNATGKATENGNDLDNSDCVMDH